MIMENGKMAAKAEIYSSVPERLLDLLVERLPSSLTILRRLQFAAYRNTTSPDARIIVSSDIGGLGDGSTKPKEFTVAYARLRGGPDTQMLIYSTMEQTYQTLSPDEVPAHEELIMSCLHELIKLRQEHEGDLYYGDGVLLGSLHAEVRGILQKTGRITGRPSGDYDKWLFKMEDVPEADVPLDEGMYWDTATLDDCRIVVSRTDIPRPAEMLVKLPGLMLKLKDTTPVAWAFIGTDGSLISLHCEDGFRRRGIAKMLASRLLRKNGGQFAGGEWSSADVAPDNMGSRAMCKSLGGTPHWSVSWVTLNLAESV